jgi:hypothetical protein
MGDYAKESDADPEGREIRSHIFVSKCFGVAARNIVKQEFNDR